MENTTPGPVTGRTPRPSKGEVRARVLRAAATEFAAHGFDGTSIDQVAAAAGFTKGAVYSSFTSKDELFLELMTQAVTERVERVEQALAGTTDLAGALAAVGEELSRPEADWHVLFLEFWQRAVRDPQARTAFVAARRELRALVAGVAGRVLAGRPVSTSLDPDALAFLVLALSNGVALEAVPDPDALPPGVLTRVLTDLLGPPPATTD